MICNQLSAEYAINLTATVCKRLRKWFRRQQKQHYIEDKDKIDHFMAVMEEKPSRVGKKSIAEIKCQQLTNKCCHYELIIVTDLLTNH